MGPNAKTTGTKPRTAGTTVPVANYTDKICPARFDRLYITSYW